MRVLLLGVTGKVGCRLFPALVAHNHTVVAYVRDPAKISEDVASRASSILTGCATDSDALTEAMLSHRCDAVINAAGFAIPFGKGGNLPPIHSAVSKAAQAARTERGGPPLRCWFLSGWPLMDSPNMPHTIMDYFPFYLNHRTNYDTVRSVPTDVMAWSLFCASNMQPRTVAVDYSPQPGISTDTLIARAERPVAWSDTLGWVPILGPYLNIAAQIQDYYAPLEDCVDFIAADLAKGLSSEWVGKRVGVKVRRSIELYD